MSDSYVVSIRSLGNQPGDTISSTLRVVPSEDWSTDAIQWAESEVPLEVNLQSITDGVLVSVLGNFSWTSLCSRCVEPMQGTFNLNVQNVFFNPDAQAVTDADEDDELYILTAGSDELDLEPLVRDELILGMPTVPVCSPSCEGLCLECGVPWAELDSSHSHEVIDPRWSALSKFTQKPGESMGDQ